MNRSQLELASSTIATQDEFLGEAFAQRSAELNASLRGSETSPDEAIKNRELLDRVIEKLPHCFVSSYNQYIATDSAANVKWLQASLVWVSASKTFGGSIFSMPAFVIGSAPVRLQPKTRLLIHGLYEDGDNVGYLRKRGVLQTTEVRSGPYRKWHPEIEPTAEGELSVKELDQMHRRNSYILNSGDSKMKYIKGKKLSNPLHGITNEMLAKYKVFEHIGGLLLAFGNAKTKQEVQDIIEASSTT